MAGATALKTAFDSFRSAIGLVKDVQSLGGATEQQKATIDNALATAISTVAIAQAEIAKALGYELCKCDFPPTPMRTDQESLQLSAGDSLVWSLDSMPLASTGHPEAESETRQTIDSKKGGPYPLTVHE